MHKTADGDHDVCTCVREPVKCDMYRCDVMHSEEKRKTKKKTNKEETVTVKTKQTHSRATTEYQETIQNPLYTSVSPTSADPNKIRVNRLGGNPTSALLLAWASSTADDGEEEDIAINLSLLLST